MKTYLVAPSNTISKNNRYYDADCLEQMMTQLNEMVSTKRALVYSDIGHDGKSDISLYAGSFSNPVLTEGGITIDVEINDGHVLKLVEDQLGMGFSLLSNIRKETIDGVDVYVPTKPSILSVYTIDKNQSQWNTEV